MRAKANATRHAAEFKEGDMVWLDARNIDLAQPCKKFKGRYIGPYPVVKVVNPVAFKLDLSIDKLKIHPVFHSSLLKRYVPAERDRVQAPARKPATTGQVYAPDDAHPVERILARVKEGRTWFYFVKWLGWPEDANTWEPTSNVRRLDAYKEFLQNPVQWVGRENHTLVNA
jgi:hypothetical protein